ncbi:AsnC family transcriptional regulator [Halomonas icarae]|uniref:siroheme decarboxylase n=1 Tax=Halomonas icarae TaxID=2691040 RepID=A0A7X5AM13_9GAMM|nr:AsnC family transcriptional regulator [Halomonas icarae]MDR5902850.1 AsnC family transcriptional regulator [Halomonas icarae]NAW12389.1 AsnC family transcriptional regulator [Halomonas icarae]
MSVSTCPSSTPIVDDAQRCDARGLDAVDRAIVLATQAGLPLVPDPWGAVGREVGISGAEVLERMQAMQANGVIRRVAAVPNHYRLGYVANGMTVWDVDDMQIERLGREVAAIEGVSHCYRRPRHLPHWPYNLFAMLHGRSREEVERQAEVLRRRLGDACRDHRILYSSRILKKTGLRLAGKRPNDAATNAGRRS